MWNADFFEPSTPLFAAAPWIMVRGDSETCNRAGEGWFRFLHATVMPKECSDFTEPFAITLGDLTFVVMDTASADPEEPAVKKLKPDSLNELLQTQFQSARRLLAADAEGWLVTHRPLYGLRSRKSDSPGNAGSQSYVFDNITLQAAVQPADLLSRFQMIISGHIHIFEALNVEAVVGGQTLRRPQQLVVGTGGDTLELFEGCGVEGGSSTVQAKGLAIRRFGYTVWDREGKGWSGYLFNATGKLTTRCRLEGGSLSCDCPTRKPRRPGGQ